MCIMFSLMLRSRNVTQTTKLVRLYLLIWFILWIYQGIQHVSYPCFTIILLYVVPAGPEMAQQMVLLYAT